MAGKTYMLGVSQGKRRFARIDAMRCEGVFGGSNIKVTGSCLHYYRLKVYNSLHFTSLLPIYPKENSNFR